jgi:hypothetical protein
MQERRRKLRKRHRRKILDLIDDHTKCAWAPADITKKHHQYQRRFWWIGRRPGLLFLRMKPRPLGGLEPFILLEFKRNLPKFTLSRIREAIAKGKVRPSIWPIVFAEKISDRLCGHVGLMRREKAFAASDYILKQPSGYSEDLARCCFD